MNPTVSLSTAVALLIGLAAALPASALEVLEPEKIQGPETCVKCHAAEVQRWQQTPHHRTIEELHRKPEAKAIAQRLGLRSIKRNDTCVRCHYTEKQVGSRNRIVAGISCESCHGAARDWLELHADYGGEGITRLTESPAHRDERRRKSIAAGMNNPTNVYLVAKQCLSCHTTPEEKLVDVGGHPAGSQEFNLVAWSQGMVRHNFVRSDGQVNAPSPPERLRVMHVVGVMADLEYSLRAAAKATTAGKFGMSQGARAANRKQQLEQIQQLINDPRIAEALTAANQLELRLGNSEAILAVADTIGRAAEAFAAQVDGTGLAAIDPLLPRPEQYK